MSKLTIIIVALILIVCSFYYGKHLGFIEGVIETTADQMMTTPTYL
jgi:hypothetical protein